MKKSIAALILASAVITGLTGVAFAEWKPTEVVSVTVAANAGGDTDLISRIFAQYAKKYCDANFIVVNTVGGAGSVAFNQVLSSHPDGHTFLVAHCNINIANLAGVTDFNYKAFRLGPTFAKNPAQQLYVNAQKYKDLNDFIAAAKANPGKLTASTEVGAYSYYNLQAFAKAAGIEIDLVDVGTTSEKITAMLAGMVDLMPSVYSVTKDYVDAGQFNILGVPTAERYEMLKDYPTFKEQGIDFVFPDLDYSFYFPAGTPDEVIAFYDDLTEKIVNDSEAREAMAKIHTIPYFLNSADSEKNDERLFATLEAVSKELEK